jgi:hypothetical protein
MMNLQEMKQLKEKLILHGVEAYPNIAKVVDTLGELRVIRGRNYKFLEYDGITAIHSRNIIKAKVTGNCFLGWLYRDNLFVTVGDPVPLCPFRTDRVMVITLDNTETIVIQADKDNQIFVPYHLDWYNRIMLLLPKAEGILGEASRNDSEAERETLVKQLFLNQNELGEK